MELAQIIERFRADRYAVELTGIEIIEVRPNYAKTRLTVEPKHMNAVGIMQGGALFTLADFTFAVAANAGMDESTVAIECHISFLKPVTEGILFAEATLISRSRSLAMYDIAMTNETGDLVAKFSGRGFVRKNK
jgi:acyl-CoA thioesterase